MSLATGPVARCAIAAILLAPTAARGQESADSAFYRAAYLQTEQRDYDGAADVFAQVAQSADASPEIKQSAAARLIECREELAARDLASLMPAESFAYVQFANIGDQLARLLSATGLAGGPASTGGSSPRIPLEEGLSLPLDFQLSPALVRELGRLGGAAASVVSISERGIPEGLVAVHLGESDLLRGLAETGLQVLTPQQSLGGYPTYRIPVEGTELWLVQTARLMLLSTSRDQVAGAVGRIQHDDAAPRLSTTAPFRNVASDRNESLLYAWADAQRAAPIVEQALRQELRGEELVIVQTVLGLRQLESASVAIGATHDGVRAEAAIRFQPDHQHLIYGLLRTAPIGADAFSLIPQDAAAIAAIGLNPPLVEQPTHGAQAPAQQSLALMDLGRELFANVESITVFTLPGSAPLPEVAAVVQARDGNKSKQLWNQLLSLPTLFGVLPPQSVSESQLAGRAATQYQFPEAPPIVVVQPSDGALLVGTAGAVEAALNAVDTGVAVDQHPQLGPVIRESSSSTSKALYVSVGGLIRCARPMMGPHELREMDQIAQVVKHLTAGLTIDEAPAEFRVRLEVAGVPKISDALKTMTDGRMANFRAPSPIPSVQFTAATTEAATSDAPAASR